MAGILSTVAQNIKVTFTAKEGTDILKVLTTFPVTTIESASGKIKSYVVDLGDLQSEEKRDILLKISVPSGNQSDLIDVKITYDNVISNSQVEDNELFKLSRPEVVENQSVNMDIDVQHNRMIAVKAMEESSDFAIANNLEKAREVLKEGLKAVKESPSAKNDFVASLATDMQKCLDALVSQVVYNESGSNYMNTMMNCHSHQRSCAPTTRSSKQDDFNSYAFYSESSAKMNAKVKFSSPSKFEQKK